MEAANTASLPPGKSAATRVVVFGRDRIRIEDIATLARGEAKAAIDGAPDYRERLETARDCLRILELHRAGPLPCPAPADVQRQEA
jgi:hypothetical protein